MFSIVIPLYNEEENIIPLINEIFLALKEYDSYEIILVDDFSNDQTLKLISNKNNKLLKILQNKKRKGQSYSIYKGVKTSQFDTIITLDGDGQNNPKDIPKLLNIFDQNHKIELVGGLRVKRKDNLIKVISSKIANKIRLIILKDKCKDTGCSLKVFNKNVF